MRTRLGTLQEIDELLVGGRERIRARGVTGTGRAARVASDRPPTDNQMSRPRVYSCLFVSSVSQPTAIRRPRPSKHSRRTRSTATRARNADHDGADAARATQIIHSRCVDAILMYAAKESRVLWRRLHGTRPDLGSQRRHSANFLVLARSPPRCSTAFDAMRTQNAAPDQLLKRDTRLPWDFSAGLLLAYPRAGYANKWRTLLLRVRTGRCQNGVPCPEGTPNGVV
jgi:hypothetical protein